MTFDEAVFQLRARQRMVPTSLELASVSELEVIEHELGIRFHADYRRFLLEASDATCGTLEPGIITNPSFHTYLPEIVKSARANGVPEHLFPICEDNSNYYCITAEGTIRYWTHDGSTNEGWSTIADWIVDVWIGERA